jgi:hypothetical protein
MCCGRAGTRLALPPEAVGRDYRPFGDFVTLSPDWRDLELSLGGYAGLAIGARYGLEVRIAGWCSALT